MMKKGIVMAAVVLSLAACKENQKVTPAENTKDSLTSHTESHEENAPDMHNAQNSLDWAGAYEGTLPCADCPGIKTVIQLNNDNTFSMVSEYLDRNLKIEDKGEIMWHDGTIVHLKGKETDIKLKVGENQLFYLDQDGSEIEGALKEHYILTKK